MYKKIINITCECINYCELSDLTSYGSLLHNVEHLVISDFWLLIAC